MSRFGSPLWLAIRDEPLQAELRSGVVLCQLLNRLSPGAVPKVSYSATAAKQLENLTNYLAGTVAVGMEAYMYKNGIHAPMVL